MVFYRSLPVFLIFFVGLPGSAQETDQLTADFRYAPSTSFAVICLPDDWLKTVVTNEGALGYDFGPGPYARPLTQISVGVLDDTLSPVRQYLADPSVPAISTEFEGRGVRMSQIAFATVADSIIPFPADPSFGFYRRVGGLNGCVAWCAPSPQIPESFHHVAWGTNRPILYRVRVAEGSRKRVGLGFCEVYKRQAGARIMLIRVEGAEPMTFDDLRHAARNEPQVVLLEGEDLDRDGELSVEIHAAPSSPDPNVILNALWVFPDTSTVEAGDLVSGSLRWPAELEVPCGTEMDQAGPAPRVDVLTARIDGENATPVVRVQSRRQLQYDSSSSALLSEGTPFLVVRPSPIRVHELGEVTVLELPEGSPAVTVYVVNSGSSTERIRIPADLGTELEKSRKFWKREARLPTARITVPDSGIQYLLDASIRTIYQVRERVDGRHQFQPGPSVYRGLWVGDLALTAVAALMLGDTAGVREYIEQIIPYQLPSGQVRVMVPGVSLIETPALLFAINRYARSTGDQGWLLHHWSVMCNGVEWIQSTRESTLRTPGVAYAGLMPPGFVDGGISIPMADYGSVWWSLIGLESAVDAAGRVGDTAHARQWKALYEEMLGSLGTAARRDMQTGPTGERFLPVAVGGPADSTPQRGQYTFLLPLPHAEVFERGDPLMREIISGNLALLDAHTAEGLVVNAGWLNQGVWPWFGAFHAMGHAFYGSRAKAAELLYAVANHAAPSGTWVEEQQQRDAGTGVSGDASNAEAAAAFVTAVRTMIARERGRDLELLPCVPAPWFAHGARMELRESYGPFGPFSLSFTIDSSGAAAHLRVSAIDGRGSSGSAVVILDQLRDAGFSATDGSRLPDRICFAWGTPIALSFERAP